MEQETNKRDIVETWEQHSRRGKIYGGIFIVIVGALLLAHRMGVAIPHWVFTWQMLIIGIGLFTGIKHGFRGAGWLILVGVGTIFLCDDVVEGVNLSMYLWPILIIAVGLWMIFGPRKRCRDRWGAWQQHVHKHGMPEAPFPRDVHSGDYIDNTAIFASLKKNVISKDFKGGEINCVFGGAEVNLTQADINGKADLEVNCILGGATLIIPANWEIKSELTAVMGGMEDKRQLHPDVRPDGSKVLILRGTAVMGGIEIRSF
jgi:predicted membrane protein